MAARTCPSCGEPLPPELGQHALTATGLVQCPSCGETVTLERADDAAAAPDPDDWFAGSETIEGVLDELSEKEGGPE